MADIHEADAQETPAQHANEVRDNMRMEIDQTAKPTPRRFTMVSNQQKLQESRNRLQYLNQQASQHQLPEKKALLRNLQRSTQAEIHLGMKAVQHEETQTSLTKPET